MIRFSMLCSVMAVGLISICGCGSGGPALGRVTGTVTVDGKPASGVQVRFQPVEGGRPSMGVTDASGNYELVFSPEAAGALVGTHEVTIAGAEPSVDAGAASSAPLTDTAIPASYAGMKKTVEVKSGRNTIDVAYP